VILLGTDVHDQVSAAGTYGNGERSYPDDECRSQPHPMSSIDDEARSDQPVDRRMRSHPSDISCSSVQMPVLCTRPSILIEEGHGVGHRNFQTAMATFVRAYPQTSRLRKSLRRDCRSGCCNLLMAVRSNARTLIGFSPAIFPT